MVAAAHGRQRGRRRPRWPPPVARLVGLCALSVGSAGDAVAAAGSLGAASSRALSSSDDLAALAAVTGALLDAAVGAGDALVWVVLTKLENSLARSNRSRFG